MCRWSSGGGLQTRGFGATWGFQALPEKLPGLAAPNCPQPSPWSLGLCDLSWQQEPRSCDSGYRTPGGETILDYRAGVASNSWVLQRRALSWLMAGQSERAAAGFRADRRPPPGNAGASRNGTRQGSSSRKPYAPPVSLRTSASQSSACKFIHLHGLTWRVVVSGKPHDPSTCCPVLIPCSGSERGRKRMSR